MKNDLYTGEGPNPVAEKGERIGIFPSWSFVYASVVVYGVILILLLTLFSRLLDFGVGS